MFHWIKAIEFIVWVLFVVFGYVVWNGIYQIANAKTEEDASEAIGSIFLGGVGVLIFGAVITGFGW